MPSFYVFFDKETVEKENVELAFLSPHSAFGKPGFEYMVLCSQARDDPKYKELDGDPKFIKAVASGN